MSDGIRSGVNWIRLNEQVERLRDRLDHQRLGQPGHADEQGVAAAQDGGEDALDHVVLAHDPLGHLAAQPGDGLDQALELLDVVVLAGRGGCGRGHRVTWRGSEELAAAAWDGRQRDAERFAWCTGGVASDRAACHIGTPMRDHVGASSSPRLRNISQAGSFAP